MKVVGGVFADFGGAHQNALLHLYDSTPKSFRHLEGRSAQTSLVARETSG